MKTTIEISMYPLTEDYEQHILHFIKDLHEKEGIKVRVNAMSTQVQGDFKRVHEIVQESMFKAYERGLKCSFILKVLPGELDLDYQYDG